MPRSSKRNKISMPVTVSTEIVDVKAATVAIQSTIQCTLPLYVREIAAATGHDRVVDFFAYYDKKFGWDLFDCLGVYTATMTHGQVAVRIVHSAFETAQDDYAPFPFASYEEDDKKTGPLWTKTWTKEEYDVVVRGWVEGGEPDQFTAQDKKEMQALADAAWRHDGKSAFKIGKKLCRAWNWSPSKRKSKKKKKSP